MISGVMTALVTPFKTGGEIDTVALDRLIDFQIKQGIKALVPMGTTGESPTVSHKENLEVVERVIQRVGGRIPVIAGTGSNSTEEAIRMTKLAKGLGASASLQVAPYYNKPTQEGLYRHFSTIADAVSLPLVLYNIKGRSAVNINTETLLRLAKHPQIIAVKEASGDLHQIMDVLAQKPEDFALYSGDDNMALALMAMGADGVISVASNIIPQAMKEMIELAAKGDFTQARRRHYQLLPLFKALFLETNPLPVKSALAQLGLIEAVWRLPLCSPSADTIARIKIILQEQKLLP